MSEFGNQMSRGGLLLVDKPSGITSHDLVDEVRRALGIKQVGHAGTLDPLATGLMVVLVGKATRLAQYLQAQEKSYEVDLRLGFDSETWDRDGEVRELKVRDGSYGDQDVYKQTTYSDFGGRPIDQNLIEVSVRSLMGVRDFPIPPISAVKSGGKKLYQYARAGLEAPRLVRKMSFWNPKVLNWEVSSRQIRVRLSCSKGAFVRSWVRALGEVLGEPAIVWELRRLSIGSVVVDRAIPLEQLMQTAAAGSINLADAWIPLDACLKEWPVLALWGRWVDLTANGQVPEALLDRIAGILVRKKGSLQGVRLVDSFSGRLVALAEYSPGKPGHAKLSVVFGRPEP